MKVIVVGGGTAGWVSLAYLSATTNAELTIIHSEEVDNLGVGESTTPTIKHVAEVCGIDEVKWMKNAKASYKYGIEFLDFNSKGSRWLHNFDDLLPGQSFHTPTTEFGKNIFKKEISSVEYFLTQRKKGLPNYNIDWYNNSQGSCEYLLSRQLSPYTKQHKSNFNKFPGYGYHINAHEFGNSLRNNIPLDRYTEIKGTIKDVEYDDNGIKNLTLDDGSKINADLYIDCSGFKRLLINKLTSFNKYERLINNAAIWGTVEHQSYKPCTVAAAQDYGWIWETPTWGRIGTGFVYCDDFLSVDDAENHMKKHWRSKGLEWKADKSVKFTGGSLDRVAVKNVIANGLCQSFIEPLESTSIMVICVTIKSISKLINKNKVWGEKESNIVSKVMKKFLNETMEFVLYHYTLSDRQDTDYWRAYKTTDVLETVSTMIEKKLKQEWVNHAETLLNGYNWASMLVAYDKPYLGQLPKIEEWEMNNYEFYTKQLVENYRYHYKNNMTVKDRLEYINS